MSETFLALLTAHLLGDFLLQSKWMIRHKRRPMTLTLHVGIVTAASALLLGSLSPLLLAGVFVSHWLIDWYKLRFLDDGATAFVLDQLAHLLSLLALSLLFANTAVTGLYGERLSVDTMAWLHVMMVLTSGVVATVFMGGYLIEKLTAPLAREIINSTLVLESVAERSAASRLRHEPPPGRPIKPTSTAPPVPAYNPLPDGLKQGGKIIGWLERLLTLILLLAGMAGSIGFLVAAKSVLRFGDIRDSSHRKMAEYIIIGTFMSFSWALVCASLTRTAMQHYLPVG